MSFVAAGSSLTCAFMGILVRYRARVSDLFLHLCQQGVLGVGIVNSFAHLMITQDMIQTTNVLYVYFIAAYMNHSVRQFLFLSASVFAIWMLIVNQFPTSTNESLVHFLFANILSFFFATAIFYHRNRTLGLLAAEAAHRREVERKLQFANQQLTQQAMLDPLTGIANRRQLDLFLQERWELAQDSAQPMVVMLCDIDHFKVLNDEFGHAVGDQVLRKVATAIQASTRGKQDIAARYGGEEFVLVFTNMSPQVASEVALRICERVKKATQGPHQVSLSIGIYAGKPESEQHIQSALKLADEALYETKQAGRDGYRLATSCA